MHIVKRKILVDRWLVSFLSTLASYATQAQTMMWGGGCHKSETYARAGRVCDSSPRYREWLVRTVGSRVGTEIHRHGPCLDSFAVADL
jgi:hypothetical protein